MNKNIIYGADYNPEQWSKDVWHDDMKLMKLAGVNMVNINIFGWAILQPSEDKYIFTDLDYLMDLLDENDIEVDLATGTASQPAWMSKKYNDVLPLDESMNTVWYGSRQTYCPSSKNYKRVAAKLVVQLAIRYKDHPALKMWHINNEYSDHTNICYCENCANEFRVWLIKKYCNLKTINDVWGTSFWSQKYYLIDEIVPPRKTSADHNPGLLLDYKRFMSDQFLELYKSELDILKNITPEIPVTTNFMGNNNKPLDYFKWAKSVDVISWDSYPDISKVESRVLNAFTHDLMRSLKNKPHIMMEQAPNQVNWRTHNPNKRPGEMGLYSYQALAHGADGIMFFQWRQSLKGAEKYHSGMITHTGDDTSRTFKEIKKLGNELKYMSEITSSKYSSKVGILFDYDNWWALEYEPSPSSSVKYMEQIISYYGYFYENNIPVDILSYDSCFDNYELIVAPNLYMIKPNLTTKLEKYVGSGGQFVTSFFSGIVNDNDNVFEGGYPGPLKNLLGIEVEEYDVLTPEMFNSISYNNKDYSCNTWCDVIKLKTAFSLGDYNQDYYKGSSAITRNNYELGNAYYIGTKPEKKLLHKILDEICETTNLKSNLITDNFIEVTVRENENKKYYFILNHANENKVINLDNKLFYLDGSEINKEIIIEPKGVVIGWM